MELKDEVEKLDDELNNGNHHIVSHRCLHLSDCIKDVISFLIIKQFGCFSS